MADESVVGEDPAKVRMTAEKDSVQVEGFALVPVRRRPDFRHGVDHWRLARRAMAAKPKARVARDGKQLVCDSEASLRRRRLARAFALDAATEPSRGRFLGRPLRSPIVEIVDTRQVDQLLEGECRQVAQVTANGKQVNRRDLDRELARQRRDRPGTLADPGRDGLCGLLDAAHAVPRAIVLVRRILSCNCRMP